MAGTGRRLSMTVATTALIVAPLLLLLFPLASSSSVLLLPFVVGVASSSTTTVTSGSDDAGEILLPRDVAFDDDARLALESLRRRLHAPPSSSDEEEEEEEEKKDEEATRWSLTTDLPSVEEALRQLRSSPRAERGATLTLIGYKGGRLDEQINQDRSFVVSPYLLDVGSDDVGSDDSKKTTEARLLGVFDGHADLGEVVSDLAVTTLPSILRTKLKALTPPLSSHDNIEAIKKALIETFVEIDESVPNDVKGGCTASVILQIDHLAFVANAGDSRSFLASVRSLSSSSDGGGDGKDDAEVKVVYSSREDKPDLPDERSRIEAAGGTVSIPDDPDEDVPRVVHVDEETGYTSGLAMSRSLGDRDAKESGVIPTPIVDVLDLREHWGTSDGEAADAGEDGVCREDDDAEGSGGDAKEGTCQPRTNSVVEIVAVSATDGLMDYFEPIDVAKEIAKSSFFSSRRDDDDNGDGHRPHPLTVCEGLIYGAAQGWEEEMGGEYRDDIAIATVALARPVALQSPEDRRPTQEN